MLKLKAEKREVFGKELKASRLAGELPVVVYGRKAKASSLFVKAQDLKKAFESAGESSIIELTTPSGGESVLIHDVVFHPVTNEPIHADFYVVEKDVALKVKIPIEYTGLAPAVKELGGTLVKVMHELEVEALPADLPHSITVDTSVLATLESQILVRDLVLPKKVKAVNDAEDVVAAIKVVKEEVIEDTGPIDLTAIEVEKRGKEEEPAAEGEASPAEKN
ncbi:MAG: 50S ribosomal protein L25 [Patescibacteria group bacterium]